MRTFNMTPEGRRTARAYASLGGIAFSARNDVLTSAGRARTALAASFATGHGCSLCPRNELPADLTSAERERRVTAIKKEHYRRMALKKWAL